MLVPAPLQGTTTITTTITTTQHCRLYGGKKNRTRGVVHPSASSSEAEKSNPSGLDAQLHLESLQRLTSQNGGKNRGSSFSGGPLEMTIAEQLKGKVNENATEATIPLGKKSNIDYGSLTISQKRNIRRQKYLDQVANRNDVPFFTFLSLIVILPPVIILGVAVATGFVQLFP